MKGDVAIITGASRGIGKSVALGLAKEGMITALFGRDTEKLNEVKAEIENISGKAVIFSGNIADEKFVFESVSQVLKQFGKIDHLINNAGIAILKKFTESTIDEFKTQMDANVYGVYNFTKAVADHMIAREAGSIINVSSIAGKQGFVYGTMYSATKHAVMGFTRSLFLELRKHNIRVAAVCPGTVKTEMIMNTPIQPKDLDNIIHPEDVTEVIKLLITTPVRAVINEIEIRPTNP